VRPCFVQTILTTVLAATLAGCGTHPVMPAISAVHGALAARDAMPAGSAATLEPAAAEALSILHKNIHAVQVPALPRNRQVIFAGGGHFGSLWARDGMYASMGLLATGDLPTVHDTLTALLDGQRTDGLLPRRVGSGSNAIGMIRSAIGLAPSTSTDFKDYDFSKPSVDTNPLVIWVAADYLAQSGDSAFAAKYRPVLERAAEWLYKQQEGGLLIQPGYGDWEDMVARGGKIMYSNALYYRALGAMAAIERQAGDPVHAATYDTRATALAAQIQATFWNPTAGHFRNSTTLEQFSPDGDLFAIVAGLATAAQTETILSRCDALLTLHPLLPAFEGDYPNSMIPIQLRLAGIPHYHDRFEWPWLTSLYAWAAATAGDKRRATLGLSRVSTMALREGTFEEIYEGDAPIPVKTRLYESERDFSWSAGMYLRARAALK
jgi:glycogen debranching enzyme